MINTGPPPRALPNDPGNKQRDALHVARLDGSGCVAILGRVLGLQWPLPLLCICRDSMALAARPTAAGQYFIVAQRAIAIIRALPWAGDTRNRNC